MKQDLDLSQLGLEPRDNRVYAALLREGVSSIRHIASATNINRGSVYESIKRLVDIGLVSYQQNKVNRKYFAEEPQKILSLIDQRRDELDEVEQRAKKIIPDMMNEAAYMPFANIRFFEDDEGVALILRDVLDTVGQLEKKEYYAISSKPIRQYLYGRFPNFTKQRISKNIFVKVIALGEGGDPVKVASRRWLDTASGVNPSSYTIIFGNKVATVALNDNHNPYGIVIEDEGVAEMQRLVFESLWQTTEK